MTDTSPMSIPMTSSIASSGQVATEISSFYRPRLSAPQYLLRWLSISLDDPQENVLRDRYDRIVVAIILALLIGRQDHPALLWDGR